MDCNYPADWNRKNLRNRTVKFVEELQALSDKHGLYVYSAGIEAGCDNIVDSGGATVATDFQLSDDKKYYGIYQEMVGQAPEAESSDD